MLFCRTKNTVWGLVLAYPPITMGCHVSTVANHQVGRITPLETRGNVAMAGNFGYELDLTKLTEEEKEIVKEQIKEYKDIREVIQFGDLYRIFKSFLMEMNQHGILFQKIKHSLLLLT